MKHFKLNAGNGLAAGLPSFSALALAICALLLFSKAFAEELRCAFCGKPIAPNTRYVRSAQKAFCSDSCFNSWVADNARKCAVCGQPVTDGYTKDGKAYCSLACLSTTFPKCVICGRNSAKGVLVEGDPSKFICQDCAEKPKCFACGLPGSVKRLDDGRFICDSCDKTAIYDYAQAAKAFSATRSFLREKFDISTRHPITMELLGQDKLNALSAKTSGGGTELGLFEYNGTIETRTTGEIDSSGNMRKLNETSRKVDETWRIYALYGMPEDRLAEVFAHELAHDWMQEFCPGIKDSKTKEGWAEYIAWKANSALGRNALNVRIENCKDPIYGDGFRMIRKIAEHDGFDGLKLHLRKLSASKPQPQ